MQPDLPLFPEHARETRLMAATARQRQRVGLRSRDARKGRYGAGNDFCEEGEAMATPGTILISELREQHLEWGNVLMVTRGGKKIHRGMWWDDGLFATDCGLWKSDRDVTITSQPEIPYGDLCRHCFRELLRGTRA